MDRKMRRNLEAAITKHGDRCAVCKKPYQHMTRTYTGVAADGGLIVTCDACKAHLSVCYAMGLYVLKGVAPLGSPPNTRM